METTDLKALVHQGHQTQQKRNLKQKLLIINQMVQGEHLQVRRLNYLKVLLSTQYVLVQQIIFI